MIPQLFSPTGFVLEGFQTQCSFNYIDRDIYTRSFMMIMMIGGLVLPLFVMIFFYSRIWMILKSNEFFLAYSAKANIRVSFHNRNEAKHELNLKVADEHDENKACLYATNNSNNNNGKTIRNEVKLLKSIIVIIFMFCLAWLDPLFQIFQFK